MLRLSAMVKVLLSENFRKYGTFKGWGAFYTYPLYNIACLLLTLFHGVCCGHCKFTSDVVGICGPTHCSMKSFYQVMTNQNFLLSMKKNWAKLDTFLHCLQYIVHCNIRPVFN